MKTTLALIAALLAPSLATAEKPFVRDGWLRGVQTAHPSTLQLNLDDDKSVCLGDSNDVCLVWDTSGTDQFRINMTGTGTVIKMLTGNTTWAFQGSASFLDNQNMMLGSGDDYYFKYRLADTALELFSSDVDDSGTDGVIWWAKDGQPYFYVGTVAQAIRLDATNNGYLYLYNEDGSDADLVVGKARVLGSPSGPTFTGAAAGQTLNFNSNSTSSTTTTGVVNLFSGGNTNEAPGGDTGDLNIYSGPSTAGTAGEIQFAVNGAPGTGTDALSIDASGYVYIGDNVTGSPQAIRLDASTDGYLYLADEGGTAASLSIGTVLQLTSNFPAIRSNAVGQTLDIYTNATATEAATGTLNLHSGNNTNSGDYDSGLVQLHSGSASGTGADSNNVWIYSGAAQDQAGDIVLSVDGAPGSGTTLMTLSGASSRVEIDSQYTLLNYAGDNVILAADTRKLVASSGAISAAQGVNSGNVEVSTGNNADTGNYNSGSLKFYTGSTDTDGDTGDIEIYTGAAGAGAADAGDIVLSVNGAPGSGTTALTIDGATGAVLPNRVVGTDALAEPFACAAAVAGAVVYVDDTNDSAAAVRCVCFATTDDGAGNPTMDWRDAADPAGTACSAF